MNCAPAIRYHAMDFLAASDKRSKPVADIEQGYISTASCILANLSLKLGRTLTWDAGSQRVAGDEEANRLLRRPYRSPWVHPEVEGGVKGSGCATVPTVRAQTLDSDGVANLRGRRSIWLSSVA